MRLRCVSIKSLIFITKSCMEFGFCHLENANKLIYLSVMVAFVITRIEPTYLAVVFGKAKSCSH